MNAIKLIKSISSKALLLVLLSAPIFANAVSPVRDERPIGAIPTNTGVFQSTNLVNTISIVLRWALGFIGILVFLIFLFAGFEYATSGGDNTKAESAQKRMVNAIIGLIIIFFISVVGI